MPSKIDHYNLPRGLEESARLDAQHEAYVKIVGFLLHPRIKASLPEDARIADVGTGTAVWLHDLAKEAPASWSFHGFDMSDAQFPQNGTERRTKYDLLNITEPIPEEFKGRFDVVHLRLLVCGLRGDQWMPAASNALQLLKPGGWVQWHESDFRDIYVVQNVPGASIKAGSRLFEVPLALLQKSGKTLGHVAELPETVAAAGFVDVEDDLFSTARVPEVRKQLNDVQYEAARAISQNLLEKDPRFPMSAQEWERVVADAREELADGKAYFQWNMRVVTGRRPANPAR